MTSDEVATGSRIDLASQSGEVGRFFQPVVEEKGLIGEGLPAGPTQVALHATEGFGHMKAIPNEPVGVVGLELMSRAGRGGTEEVLRDH